MSTETFFEGKRPWSKIKDRILGSYLNAYLAKVNRLGRPILLIDAFAGPGAFEDGTAGSPLIICKAARQFANGNWEALFFNEEREYHEKLDSVLKAGNWYPHARAILGDSKSLLQVIPSMLGDKTVLLYLDPFGLKDCAFSTLEPFLKRNKLTSTEIIMNLSMPVIHRLAGRESDIEGTIDPQIQQQRFELLSRVLGGDYWKEALLTPNIDTKVRERRVVEGYMDQLSSTGYLKFTGACPIQATRDSATKYYMIFASPHRDARKLFNDEMLRAFQEYMSKQEYENTLFADYSWTDWRDTKELQKITMQYIANHPGEKRLELWHLILADHFLRFTESEYKKVVTTLFQEGRITSPTERPTKRLNDDCRLFLA